MRWPSIINPRSLSGTGFLSVLITILIIAPTIGIVWIWSQYEQKSDEIKKIKTRYITIQEKRLVNDIENIFQFIDYKRSNTEKRVRKIIKDQVHSAYSLAAHIYGMQKEILPIEEINFRIKETLRPIRWDNGTGYFFIFDYDGLEQLNADRPDMEGINLINVKDLEGKLLVKGMIELVLKNDSGFYSYHWSKPGKKDSSYKKMTYVKNFKPAGWVIGAGYYLEDMEETIKKEVLQRIEEIMDDENQFTFVIQDNGFCLFHPDKRYNRKNILNHLSDDGQNVIQEIITLTKEKSRGSLQYQWKKPNSEIDVNSIGHAATLADWGWIIVKGVFLDDMQNIIETEKAQLKIEQRKNIVMIFLIACAAIIISLIFGRVITSRMDTGITAFTDFFQKAAGSHTKIDQNTLIFDEFRFLGRLANQMVEDRISKERALDQSMLETVNLQNLLKNITDSMPSMLMAIDKDMKIIQWNKMAEDLTGISAKDAGNRLINQCVTLTKKEMTIIGRALGKGESSSGIREQQDQGRYESLTVYPLISNHITGAVVQIDDITEKIRLEEMMIQSEKMLSVGGLAAGMAHEINNPLSGISGNIDVLKNRLFSDLSANLEAAKECNIKFDKIKDYAEKRSLPGIFNSLNLAVSRAAVIVRDMLSFSRMRQSESEYCDLAELLEKTIELAATSYDLKKKYDFKEINIVRHYDSTLPEVKCSMGKIQQVFLNLLTNGAHAMHKVKSIRSPQFDLFIKHNNDMVTIEIKDNGTGMQPEIRKRIFEPFFTTKQIGIGTGLGLSVSYFIITDHHQGTLEVESQEGVGTRFIIQLPVNPEKRNSHIHFDSTRLI